MNVINYKHFINPNFNSNFNLCFNTIRNITNSQSKLLSGKNSLVTGSTSGIGLGIARVLASNGSNIVLNGFGDANEIEKIRSSIENEFKVKVLFQNADISKYEDVNSLINNSTKELGSLDILVNNAGIQHVSSIDKFSLERWNAVISTNLSSVFYAIQAVLPHMKKQNFGRIINIASVHGLVASTHKSAYVAAKHGVVGLTKVVALELAETPITCNAICPGWVLTPLVDKQIHTKATEKGISYEQAKADLVGEKQPSKKMATPEQIGDLVVFLSSQAAQQIRGVSIPVDGGWVSQ